MRFIANEDCSFIAFCRFATMNDVYLMGSIVFPVHWQNALDWLNAHCDMRMDDAMNNAIWPHADGMWGLGEGNN